MMVIDIMRGVVTVPEVGRGGGHWQGTGSGTTGANVTIELKKR